MQNIISSNISKYYPQIFCSRFSKYYQLKYLSGKSLSIEFNQEDENLKVSTQRNSTEFCFPPDWGVFSSSSYFLVGHFQNFAIFAVCEKKVWETSGFAHWFVCHFLPPVRRSQNFPKLSGATNDQNGRPGNTVGLKLDGTGAPENYFSKYLKKQKHLTWIPL